MTDMNTTNTAVDTTVTEQPEKKTKALPHNIVLITAGGQAIVNVAKSATEYFRYYYDSDTVSNGVLDDPRKIKHVTLPVSQNGQTFDNVWKLFEYLFANKGYQKIN